MTAWTAAHRDVRDACGFCRVADCERPQTWQTTSCEQHRAKAADRRRAVRRAKDERRAARQRAAGLCRACNRPRRANADLCEEHWAKHLDRRRDAGDGRKRCSLCRGDNHTKNRCGTAPAIRAELARVWNDDPRGPIIAAAMVLIAPWMTDFNTDALAAWADVPADFVRCVALRLRESGIWQDADGSVEFLVDWPDEHEDARVPTVALLLDAMTAAGLMTRNEHRAYSMHPDGDARLAETARALAPGRYAPTTARGREAP